MILRGSKIRLTISPMKAPDAHDGEEYEAKEHEDRDQHPEKPFLTSFFLLFFCKKEEARA